MTTKHTRMSAATACALMSLSAHAVVNADATGTLALLDESHEPHITVTAGNAGSWIRPLWDWSQVASFAHGSTATPDKSSGFKVESWRDGTSLHLKFFIPDQTTSVPNTPNDWTVNSSGSYGSGNTSLGTGDQIIIVIDPSGSRPAVLQTGTNPQDKSHKYVIKLKAGAVNTICHQLPSSTTAWSSSCPVVSNTSATTVPALGGIAVSASQYVVEVRIPYTELTNSPPLNHDVGLAFAVINDLGAPLIGSNNAVKDQLTASAFPLTMPVDGSNNPLDEPQTVSTPPSAGYWSQPKHWGIGYFDAVNTIQTDVNSIVLPHNPDYFAQAIRLSSCAIGNWDVIPSPSNMTQQNLTNWYRYYPEDPCQMGVWVNAKNTNNPSMEPRPIKGRLLILWHDTFIGSGAEWHVIELTGEMAFPAGVETITRQIWASVPKHGSYGNQTTHPCLRVYVLPSDLSSTNSSTINQAWMNDPLHTGPTAVLHDSDISKIESAYGIPPYPNTSRAAQMNFNNLAGQTDTCPTAEQCRFELMSFHPIEKLAAAATEAGSSTTGKGSTNPDSKDPLVRVNISGFGVAVSNQPQKYVFLEPLGGFGWVAPLSQFGARTVKFMVGNPAVSSRDFTGAAPKDLPAPAREIVLGVQTVTTASNPPHIQLPNLKGKVFHPGQTEVLQSEITPSGGAVCPPGCGPCKNLIIGSEENSRVPGVLVLAGGLVGVGGFTFLRRRPRKDGQTTAGDDADRG